MDSISAVARPGEVKGKYHKEMGHKIIPNFCLIRIDFLWATKLERFVAVQLVWVRLRGFEGGAPRAWRFFFIKITHFKHILIQIFA